MAQLLFRFIYRRLSKDVLLQILEGRLRERDAPTEGRFLRLDVLEIHKETWKLVTELLPEARLEKLPNVGNRHNVYLAVLTIALYQALLESGVARDYAIELLGDIGWKLYSRFLAIPKFVARLLTRDPQKMMNIVLRMMLRFPFSAPGRPGYEVEAWEAEDGSLKTYWTFCPPFAFVDQYLAGHEDRGEREAFIRTWCRFDWAFAQAIMEGTGQPGWYERPHTLSEGDNVCDMCWAARAPVKSSFS